MVVVSKVSTQEEFQNFIVKLNVKGKIFIIKPNWSNTTLFTSAQTLDWLFNSLKGTTKLIESYSIHRNEIGDFPQAQNKEASHVKARWQWIKEQDKWFLNASGIDKILSKHNVEYINVTEHTRSMKNIDSEEVKEHVEPNYGILISQDMYNFVPKRIFELRDSSFISLNICQSKDYATSLSTQNLYSLIPDPAREKKWHRKNETVLSQSILDINKIYRSIFSPCYWINEIREQNLFVGSKNSVDADLTTAKLLSLDPSKIKHLKQIAAVFGGYNHRF